jgi:hypothetical protein
MAWFAAFMLLEEPVGKVTDIARDAGAPTPGTPSPGPFEEPVVIYPNVRRLRFLAFYGLALVAICIEVVWTPLIRTPVRAESWAIGGSGMVCTLYFGWISGFALIALLTRRPFLTLTNEGLLDRSSAVAIGFIPWHEIARVAVRVKGNQSYIGIDLVHRDAILSRLNPLDRLWLRCNKRVAGYPITVPTYALRERTEFLADLIIEGASGGGTPPKTPE